ncbi:MAG: aspartokinase [Bacteroidia bacterium]|nr:MAG: aspartokinase [Bacteroidia bacterium]
MNIFVHKFGGASLKDALSVRNVAHIIQEQQKPMIVVVSAMGKTTNALENFVKSTFYKKANPVEELQSVKLYHDNIIEQLFEEFTKDKVLQVQSLTNAFWNNVEKSISQPLTYSFGQLYDQIVSVGELVSSIIVSEYLNCKGIYNTWMDIRKILISDTHWRSANVQMDISEKNYQELIVPFLSESSLILTQGFIAGTSHGYTTTLGREGSDYTASLMAYFSNAQFVTIWKDVDGVLNADPRYFKNAQKIDELSYYDAIEMTYYGATVIHPKTIKPLQNKNIPLFVKCFLHPEKNGTIIHQPAEYKKITTYSYLPNQVLISLQSQDFSFFSETHIQKVFQIINDFGIKINLMQNTALNFSICIHYDEIYFNSLISQLQKNFKVLFNTNVAILTIRNYVPNQLSSIIQGRDVLLEQRTRNHVQFVLKEI